MVIVTEQSANACEKGQPLQLNVSLQLPIVSLSDTNNEQEIKLVYSCKSKHTKLQATVLLPMKTMKVACATL